MSRLSQALLALAVVATGSDAFAQCGPRRPRSPGKASDGSPTIAFSSPADGARVSGIVNIVLRVASDAKIAGVDLTVSPWDENGGCGRPSPSWLMKHWDKGPFETKWDTTGLANGWYTLYARVVDSRNRFGYAAIRIHVDNNKPKHLPKPLPKAK
jgi:hypothetical protein